MYVDNSIFIIPLHCILSAILCLKDTFIKYILGMLSKSMGQTLRTSAAMHVLFSIDEDAPLPSTISNEAINAAIDFVEVCCQHTAYITGRGLIHEEVESVNAGWF